MSMRVSTNSFTDSFLSQVNSLAAQQNTLQNEASTGLKVTLPEDDPSVMGQVLDLQTSASQNSQYQSNINAIQSDASNASAAMNSLQTIVSRASEIATLASDSTTTPSENANYATEVTSLIQQAVQIANTKNANGDYIFGGTATTSPPFTATTSSSGTVTAVTYNGNANVASAQIAPNLSVTAQVPGENNTGSGPAGLFADSRSGANLFNDLISLQSNLASNNTSAISSTNAPALTTDDNNVISAISQNGVVQSALTSAGNTATTQATNYTTQISNDTSADLATTLTQLSQTQNAYEAALESGVRVMSLSLLDFLQ